MRCLPIKQLFFNASKINWKCLFMLTHLNEEIFSFKPKSHRGDLNQLESAVLKEVNEIEFRVISRPDGVVICWPCGGRSPGSRKRGSRDLSGL